MKILIGFLIIIVGILILSNINLLVRVTTQEEKLMGPEVLTVSVKWKRYLFNIIGILFIIFGLIFLFLTYINYGG